MTTVWDSNGCGCDSVCSSPTLPNYIGVAVAGLGTPNSQLRGNTFIYDTTLGVINQPLPPVTSQFPETKYRFWKSSADGNAVNLILAGADQFLPNIPVTLPIAGVGVEIIADTVLLKWRVVSL